MNELNKWTIQTQTQFNLTCNSTSFTHNLFTLYVFGSIKVLTKNFAVFSFCCPFIATAIKCWRCSSDASNAAFCNDPFDSSIITEQQRRWSYVECSYPPGQLNPFNGQSNQRPVCKKTKQWGKFLSFILKSWIKNSIAFEQIKRWIKMKYKKTTKLYRNKSKSKPKSTLNRFRLSITVTTSWNTQRDSFMLCYDEKKINKNIFIPLRCQWTVA